MLLSSLYDFLLYSHRIAYIVLPNRLRSLPNEITRCVMFDLRDIASPSKRTRNGCSLGMNGLISGYGANTARYYHAR